MAGPTQPRMPSQGKEARLPSRGVKSDGGKPKIQQQKTSEQNPRIDESASLVPSFSSDEIREIISTNQRLQEEIACCRREISSLKQLVTVVTGGAIPLPVPVEVFYDIGQKYIKKHSDTYTLDFPPLEEVLHEATNNVWQTAEGDAPAANEQEELEKAKEETTA